jgi:quinol monooxygenase YgiN
MLIIAGHFEVEPEQRDEFIRDRVEGMRKSQAEPGCITYVFMADPIEPGLVRLFERWESKEALAAHLGALSSAPRPATDIKVLSAEIQQYVISEVGAVGS